MLVMAEGDRDSGMFQKVRWECVLGGVEGVLRECIYGHTS